jgi:hypothetical protein
MRSNRYRPALPRNSSDAHEPIPRDDSATSPAQGQGTNTYWYTGWWKTIWPFILWFIFRCLKRAIVVLLGILVFAPMFTPGISAPQPGRDATNIAFAQQGQAVVQVIHDPLDSYHDVAQYSETVERIRDLTPHPALRKNIPFLDGFDVQATIQNRRSMGQLFKTSESARRYLHSVVELTVGECASDLILITVARNAHKGSTLYFTLTENRLYQGLVGRWFSHSSLEASALSDELAK